jgi:hypothetical protein
MYNRLKRLARQGHYKNRSTGEWTPTIQAIDSTQTKCWEPWDGQKDLRKAQVPF